MMTRKAHLKGGLLRPHATVAAILLITGVSSAQPCGWSEFTGPGPEARRDHAAAYDSRRGVVVVFGGYSPNPIGARQDTWEWDGSTWRRVATVGPNPRYQHSMAYDSVRGVCVLFGGWDAIREDEANDTWEWDGVEWRQVATTGPSPRYDHAVAFDSSRGVCVLFGGYQIGPRELGDTWEWNGVTWSQVSTTGPSVRRDHAMAYDEVNEVVVLFGGSRTTRYDDTWTWNGVEWALRSEQGPEPRAEHEMTFHADRQSVVLVGGLSSITDVWEWNGSSWSQLGEGGPRARRNHSYVYHAASGKGVLFGGLVGGLYFSDTWLWEGPCAWLIVRSSCPDGGPMEVEWRHASPSGHVALLASMYRGTFTIPNGLPCAGLRLGLASDGLQVVLTTRSDSSGSRSLMLRAPSWACSMYLQLVDLPRCAGSNVVRIAP